MNALINFKTCCNRNQNPCVIGADLTKKYIMGTEIIAVFIPIVAIISGIIMIVFLRKYQNDERMAMIEKGVDPALFDIKERRNTSLPLRFSLLMIGVGIGLFIGYFLDEHYNMQEVAYFSMLFIWGGLGLGLAYIIEEKKIKSEQE